MTKLFLDDIREPYDSTWDLVKSHKEFVEYIEKNGVPDIISFDHDLAWEHYPRVNGEQVNYTKHVEHTGYDSAKWLVTLETLPNLKQVIVHSWNITGAQNIANLFRNNNIPVIVAPFEVNQ